MIKASAAKETFSVRLDFDSFQEFDEVVTAMGQQNTPLAAYELFKVLDDLRDEGDPRVR